jgi:hypothetical protein
MTDPRWKSPFPSEVTEVRLLAAPRRAVVSIAWDTTAVDLHLMDPRPLTELCEALDCVEVVIFSRNDEEHNYLEFGQFRVEFWDEDTRIGAVECDSFEVHDRRGAEKSVVEGNA